MQKWNDARATLKYPKKATIFSTMVERLMPLLKELFIAHDEESIKIIVSKAVRDLTGADLATCDLFDKYMTQKAFEGTTVPLTVQPFPLESYIAERIMADPEPLIIDDLQADDRIPDDIYRPVYIKSLIAIPIGRDAPFGAVTAYWSTNYSPESEVVKILNSLSELACAAMENILGLREMEPDGVDNAEGLRSAAGSEESPRRTQNELRAMLDEKTAELKSRDNVLRDYEAKIDKLDAEMQEFAFVASHDLQEPLRKIQAFGSMLSNKCKNTLNDEGQDCLTRLMNAASRMSSLLKSLLDYSRIATRANPFDLADLGELVRDAVDDLMPSIKKSGGSIEIGNLPIIHADVAQMRQIFRNLINNAIKFRTENEPPHVQIYSNIENGICRIFIQDNGIGIKQEYIDLIFKPFQRLHGNGAPYEGTGMGLAICRKILDYHGGSIKVTSIPGEGSTFIIEVPLNGPHRQAGFEETTTSRAYQSSEH